MARKIKKIIVTGGAGFIGSAVIRHLLCNTSMSVVNVDALTYAGNLDSLEMVSAHPRYRFEKADICQADEMEQIFIKHQPDAIMHLAAESHVDRSIDGPAQFIQTNIVGTYTLLEVSQRYLRKSKKNSYGKGAEEFIFHHVSTDEVYGSLGEQGLFLETSPYLPTSPYSASKASSDHLVRAWFHTYGLPVVITNCSNNYGPYQFPEKLIPLMTLAAISGKALPVYGNGNQVRDWLYVEDHANALLRVLEEGRTGHTYNIGGHNEKTNLEVVKIICGILDDLVPDHPEGISRYEELITFVEDRPGHDMRYAIDAGKIGRELGWYPSENFDTGIRKTVEWYLDNGDWCQRIQDGSYMGQRIGLGENT